MFLHLPLEILFHELCEASILLSSRLMCALLSDRMADVTISNKYKKPTIAKNAPYTLNCWKISNSSENESDTTITVKMLCKQYAKNVFIPNINP